MTTPDEEILLSSHTHGGDALTPKKGVRQEKVVTCSRCPPWLKYFEILDTVVETHQKAGSKFAVFIVFFLVFYIFHSLFIFFL